MLETPEGIANADAIAAVPGIDVLLIGSNDLSDGARHSRRSEAPENPRRLREHGREACKKHGKCSASAACAATSRYVADLVKLGARFVIAGLDVHI